MLQDPKELAMGQNMSKPWWIAQKPSKKDKIKGLASSQRQEAVSVTFWPAWATPVEGFKGITAFPMRAWPAGKNVFLFSFFWCLNLSISFHQFETVFGVMYNFWGVFCLFWNMNESMELSRWMITLWSFEQHQQLHLLWLKTWNDTKLQKGLAGAGAGAVDETALWKYDLAVTNSISRNRSHWSCTL